MKVPWFAEHMREELVLHGWDITGDGAAAHARLGERVDDRVQRRGRLRVPDGDDVIVSAAVDHTDIALAAAEGEATLETDAATRVLRCGAADQAIRRGFAVVSGRDSLAK